MSRYEVEQYRARCAEAEGHYAMGDLARACSHWELALGHAISLYQSQSGPIGEAWGRTADSLMDEIESLRQEIKSRRAAPQAGSTGSAPEPQRARVGTDGETGPNERGEAFRLREKPKVRLASVAGLDEVKRELRRAVIQPMLHPELYRKFKLEAGAGVLMYGPPGNGKTYIAKAIAGEVDAAFFSVDPSQIKNKYVGESERNMRALFEAAWREPRAVIFLDECDALLGRKGNQQISTVTQFLQLADGIRESENCLLILAATNRPWAIDPAVLRPGRIGTRIYVGLPDRDARRAIIDQDFMGCPIAEDVSLDEIADRSEGFSGADLVELGRKARHSAVEREIQAQSEQRVGRADFEDAFKSHRPSCPPEKIRELEDWRDQGEAPGGAADVE